MGGEPSQHTPVSNQTTPQKGNPMRNLNPSVRGFLRGRYTRQIMDDKGNFHHVDPERSTHLQAINRLKRIEAIKRHDRRVGLGLATAPNDPRYQHLHPTKGYRTNPA